MPDFHDILQVFTKIGFFSTLLTNSLLIYLTVFHIKRIFGTYKYMIIIFASLGITFSIIEQFVKPNIHNYNKGLMFFTVGWPELNVPYDVMQIGLGVYAGFYVLVVAFLAVQFVFRYLVLMNPEYSKMFEGFGVLVWGIYPLVVGFFNGAAIFFFTAPDEYGDDYMRSEIFEVYHLTITKTPHLLIVPYDSNGSIRWFNTLYLFAGAFALLSQYYLIIYCGLQMHFQMHKELQKFSVPNRKLQKQFFKALVFQILVPTIIFVFPSTPLLLGPLLDIKMSVRSGGVCALLSLYPPIDSLVFMLIVTEYRNLFIRKCGPKSHTHPSHCTV
ncbi:unnamed protein product [Caenorhabditis brenneri]